MTDSVSSTGFNPIGFIQGIVSNSAKDAAGTSTQSGTSTSGTGTSTTGTNATSSTSTTNTLGLSSTLLSLLQGDSTSSQNGVNLSTILGEGGSGVSSTDPLAGVYNGLLANASSTSPLATAIATTQQQEQAQTAAKNPVQSLITSYNAASNAYNQTLIQNAQNAVTDAQNGTPLVA